MSNCTLFEFGKASAETKTTGHGAGDNPLQPRAETLG
jgi:hypothetical protein